MYWHIETCAVSTYRAESECSDLDRSCHDLYLISRRCVLDRVDRSSSGCGALDGTVRLASIQIIPFFGLGPAIGLSTERTVLLSQSAKSS